MKRLQFKGYWDMSKKNEIEISTIRRLKQENKPDELIRKDLGLSPARYQKYKEKLQEQERTELENVILEDIAYELLEYINSLHKTINICKSIVETGTSLERMEGQKMALFCHSELIRLLSDGPAILAKLQVAPALKKAFQKVQQQGQQIVDVEIKEDEEQPRNSS